MRPTSALAPTYKPSIKLLLGELVLVDRAAEVELLAQQRPGGQPRLLQEAAPLHEVVGGQRIAASAPAKRPPTMTVCLPQDFATMAFRSQRV
jgi:hypothetical protein